MARAFGEDDPAVRQERQHRARDLRELLVAYRDEFQVLLNRYGATNPKLFGSVARGTADSTSDIDILVTDRSPAEPLAMALADADAEVWLA